MDEERTVQRRHRSTRATTLSAVGATIVAVVAVMTVPHWFSAQGGTGPTVSQPPSPTQAPEAPGTRTWQPVTCPPTRDESCAAPLLIDHAGLLLSREMGRRLVWHREASSPASVVTTVPRAAVDRWMLVGAERAGGDSRLTVEIGGAPPVTVPNDRLSLFALSGHRAFVVRVADRGTPRDGEVLRIVEYLSR